MADSFICKCGGKITKQPETTCWTCDVCNFSKREMTVQPIVKCHCCKRKIYNGEKVATLIYSFGGVSGEPHAICRNCAEEMGVKPREFKEGE